jgi:hypothetical protein
LSSLGDKRKDARVERRVVALRLIAGGHLAKDVDLMCEEISTAWMRVIENPRSLKSLCGFNWITDVFN